MGGGGSKVTLVSCFGPKPKLCSFDLDLDQAEQKEASLKDEDASQDKALSSDESLQT